MWQRLLYAACGAYLVASAAPASAAEPPVRAAWRYLDADDRPAKGTEQIPLKGGDFESGLPAEWTIGGGKVVAAADAPEGKHYLKLKVDKFLALRTPEKVKCVPGQPHFLTLWVRSNVSTWAALGVLTDEKLRTTSDQYPGLPNTGGKWRRVQYYVWVPPHARSILIHAGYFEPNPPADGYVHVDDVRIRTATWEEMDAAYREERKQFPKYDITPRPGDGANLALSVAKWEGRAGIPGRPFVVWALGSSWTNYQGDGYPLARVIRQRFPKAPEIVYKKHAGSGTPWDFASGWVRQFVAAENPDLIFTHTNGSPEGLDRFLTEVRRHTTADVIVASLHFHRGAKLTPEEVEGGGIDWAKVREVCRKHKAEFVESRRELAAYMTANKLQPDALLTDAVHQNHHAVTRIWDNVVRHVHRPKAFTYDPAERERRIDVTRPDANLTVGEGWVANGRVLRSTRKGATLKLKFTGNRVDLIGRRTEKGGTVRVRIDGKPADEAPALATTYIRPTPAPGPPQHAGPADLAPHAVVLGKSATPQSWTITMTDDQGRYTIRGSVTGPDGEGRSDTPFTSKSGQVTIDPTWWRGHQRDEKTGRVTAYPNRKGDVFTFEVVRTAAPRVSFAGKEPGAFSAPLVRNLPNGEHTLELIADGTVEIDGLYVFSPPLK